jgi:hypothetical protein
LKIIKYLFEIAWVNKSCVGHFTHTVDVVFLVRLALRLCTSLSLESGPFVLEKNEVVRNALEASVWILFDDDNTRELSLETRP